jgi:small-conductance mechanosensitive channel
VRFKIPIGVSYNEDPQKVRKVVIDAADSISGILKEPKPDLWFDAYGDSSLNFNLIIWTSEYTQRPNNLKSQVYYEVFKRFSENNIEIPFPQRDLHVRSGLEFMQPKQN